MSESANYGARVAEYLEGHMDEAAAATTAAFRRAYPDSESLRLDDATLDSWTRREFGVLIAALDGRESAQTQLRSYAGDLGTNVSPLLTPAVTRMETWIFLSRVLAAFVWRGFADDPAGAQHALDSLEAAALSLMKADARRILDEQLVPGALQREWAEPEHVRHVRTTEEGPEEGRARTGLTGRETDIVRLVAVGRTNGEIAQELGIRQSTVKNHLSRIFDKANVNTRTELARWAIDRGLA